MTNHCLQLKTMPALISALFFFTAAAHAAAPQTMPQVEVKAQAEGGDALVKGATKTNTSLLETPQSVSVVTQDALRRRGALSSKDALEYVSSVVAGQGEGRRDEFYIRGFYSLRDASLDGVRDDNLSTRDLATTEQIEVIKGAAAALYGRGSAGGLVNRVSKKPQARQDSEVSATLGSERERRVSVDVGGALADGVNARLIGVYDAGDSYRDVVRHERKLIAPSLAFKLGSGSNLLLQAEVQREDRTPDRGVPSLNGRPLNVAPNTFYGEKFDYTKTDTEMVKAALEHRVNDTIKLSNTLQYSHADLEGVNTRNRRVNANGTVSRQVTYFPQEQRNLINQTELTIALQNHTILAGIELAKQERDVFTGQTGIAFPVNLYAPQQLLAAPDFKSLPVAFNNLFVAKTQALYLQDQINLGAQWKALLGVRFDRFQQEQTNRLKNNAVAERDDKVSSPRLGLVYQPQENQSWYVNLSRSFQPGGGDLLYSGNTPLAQVKPLQTDLQEIGYKRDWMGKRLFTTVALFRIEQRNQLTLDPSDPAGLRRLQVGKQRNQGVEVELQGTLWQGGRVNASYTYNDARIVASHDVKSGNRAEMTPRNRASVWLDQALTDVYSVGVGVLASGDQYALTDNAVRLPGHARLDAAFNYHQKSYDLKLKVSNIGNTRYYESANNNVQIQPGAPRSVNLTLTSRF
ncbi:MULTISPECIES: TonB-dependent receptor [unclassified Janthinobacterium]|uniref:TonB-dependent receptor n=1 Tax=unclassified Janthinobacterium TaxID=2610881 RepID=UPI00034495A7|nr:MULTISPECIES: TonB-dependent siderophore receptor [unclassified Janthinobacterium]MEC5159385.1 catecholate siderophore receptor [Janthinobacterium sp. CG_S6]